MADLPDALENRVGPFPVIGWIGIIGAGVGIAYLIRRSDLFGGDGEVAPVDAVVEDYGDPAAAGNLYHPIGGQVGPIPIAPQTQPAGSSAPRITTNAEWKSAAVTWAISTGNDPVQSETAANQYLAGAQMTAAQGVILGKMIERFGTAPEGAPTPDIAPQAPATAPPGTTAPPTTSTPLRSPTAARPADVTYIIRNGDTPGALAAWFYGSSAKARELHDMNRFVKSTGAGPYPILYAGKRYWLPGKLNSGTTRIRDSR